jgi:hypothetical protein
LLPSLPGGLLWDDLQYGANNVLLTVGGVLGDYNYNGVVDAADYVVWRDTFGQSGYGLAADGNGNNHIDLGDFYTWRAHFGQSTGGGAGTIASSTVPEPEALVLLLVGILMMSSPRRTILS